MLARRVRFTLTVKQFEEAWKRARAAWEMINAGIDLFTVGGVLGHKSVVSTKRYSHLVTDRLAVAIGKIGQKRTDQGEFGLG